MPNNLFSQSRNNMAPFSYVQASGPTMPTLIGSINDSHNNTMGLAKDREEMARLNKLEEDRMWSDENRDSVHQFISELDPNADDYDEQLMQLDPRAYAIPGIKEKIVASTSIRKRNLDEAKRIYDNDEKERENFRGYFSKGSGALKLEADRLSRDKNATPEMRMALARKFDEEIRQKELEELQIKEDAMLKREIMMQNRADARYKNSAAVYDKKTLDSKITAAEKRVKAVKDSNHKTMNQNMVDDDGKARHTNDSGLADAEKELARLKALKQGGGNATPTQQKQTGTDLILD